MGNPLLNSLTTCPTAFDLKLRQPIVRGDIYTWEEFGSWNLMQCYYPFKYHIRQPSPLW